MVTTLFAVGRRYGFAADHTSGANDHFYAGNYNGRNYDSSVQFNPNKADFGNGKMIIVTKVNLITTARDKNPGVMNFSINRTGSAYYDSNSRIGSIGSNSGGNYSFSLNRTDAEPYQVEVLNTLATYLQNGITFYFHVFSKNKGGRFWGFEDRARPSLEITWTYPITDGTLNSSSYKTGETATLTINPQDSSLQHDITWTINEHIIKTTNNLFGNVQDSLEINPSFIQVGEWFSEFSNTSNGQVTISTHLQDSTESLGSITKDFTVNLTPLTCKSVDTNLNVILNSLSPSSGEILDGNKYAVGKTKINYNCNYSSEVDPFSEVKLYFSGGLDTSFVLSSGQGTTTQTVTSKNKITAVLVAKSKRDLTYTSSILEIPEDSIIYYTPPLIQNINFYRTDGVEETIEGTKLGGSFEVQVDSQLSNETSTIQIALSNVASTIIESFPNFQTYTNNNILTDVTLDTNLTYNITVRVTDTLGTTTTTDFTLSTAQYLIHFPQGGQGLGLGAVGEKGSIVLGWPLKNLRISDNLDFTDITTQQGFQEIIGGPFWTKNDNIISQYLTATGGVNNGQNVIMSGQGLTCGKNNENYGLIWNDETSLFIGMTSLESKHHLRTTIISSGYDSITKKGNDTAYIAVPNENNNATTTYPILHSGNYDNIMSYKIGETIEIYSACYCYLTGGNQGFFITIPLKKSIANKTKIKLSQLWGFCRGGAGGYLIGNYGDGSGYDFLGHIGEAEVYAINNEALGQHDIDYESNSVLFRVEKQGISFGGTNNASYVFQPTRPIILTIIE